MLRKTPPNPSFHRTASGGRRLNTFDDPGLPGVLEVTVALKPVLCGTDHTITQRGIADAIPLRMCYLGWQESLAQLATPVEPDIPG